MLSEREWKLSKVGLPLDSNLSDEWIKEREVRLNPQTKQFELLSLVEWKRLTVGLPKDATVDDGIIAILGGEESTIEYAFSHRKINRFDNKIELKYLINRYKEWFERKPKNTKELETWAELFEDTHNLDAILPLIKQFATVMVDLMETKIDKENLSVRHRKAVQDEFDKAKNKRNAERR